MLSVWYPRLRQQLGKGFSMAIGAVFDCDGTLLDSMEAWHIVQSDLAKRAGIVSTDELTICHERDLR